ncbi:MAG: PQQ-binding-like beta-propeller repeat protein [Actinomycetota bacterium]
MIICSLAAVFLLGCEHDGGGKGASTPRPLPAATSEAMALGGGPLETGSPPERTRPATFTAPIAAEFQCDCPSRLLGTNGVNRAAILRSLPLPSRPPLEPPSVQALNRDGEIVWEFADLELPAGDPAAAATSVLAFNNAVVAPAAGGSLVGLDWSDGSELWELADVGVAPRRVPERPGLFTIAATGAEVHGGASYPTHPRVSVREVVSGEPRWAARRIDAFTVADDGSRLLAVRFGDEAAELIRVMLPGGSTTRVSVPPWQGRGTSLALNEDGTLSSDIGDESHTVRVDWDKPEPAVHDLGTAWTVEDAAPAPHTSDDEVIATHDATGIHLAATLDDTGRPVTVSATDDSQAQLWQRPAAEVASWEVGKDGDIGFRNTSIHEGPKGAPVVVLDLRSGLMDLQGAAGEPGRPAIRVYDLRTGTNLWEWGRSERSGGHTTIPGHGLVLMAEAGALDATGAVAEPAPLRAAMFDLRTGAAEWDLRDGQATYASVAADGGFAFVMRRDGPWLLSTARN